LRDEARRIAAGAAAQSNGRPFERAPKFLLVAIPVALVVVPRIVGVIAMMVAVIRALAGQPVTIDARS